MTVPSGDGCMFVICEILKLGFINYICLSYYLFISLLFVVSMVSEIRVNKDEGKVSIKTNQSE